MSKRNEIKEKVLMHTITVSHMSYNEIFDIIKDADRQNSSKSDVKS